MIYPSARAEYDSLDSETISNNGTQMCECIENGKVLDGCVSMSMTKLCLSSQAVNNLRFAPMCVNISYSYQLPTIHMCNYGHSMTT